MTIIKTETQVCLCCKEEHEVKTVAVLESSEYKGKQYEYEAEYFYCDNEKKIFENEKQTKDNDIKLKDLIRKQEGLLTSYEIYNLRSKYCITQNDLCLILGWGLKTVTRYESHQIQDKAHDMILKKIDADPEWFISILKDAKPLLSPKAYKKYIEVATNHYKQAQDSYLRKAIEALYAKYNEEELLQGKTKLSLDKVVDVIKYFASKEVLGTLHKVRLMKLMWYADSLSFKLRGRAITGLVYEALEWGAVPVGHSSLIELEGVPCEKIENEEGIKYEFSLKNNPKISFLSSEEIAILDKVIEKLGSMPTNDLVQFMHQEDAYKHTSSRQAISFKYTDNLNI